MRNIEEKLLKLQNNEIFKWLKSDSPVYKNISVTNYTFIKYPYSKRFNLIYSNDVNGINMMEDLNFTGIYDKEKETLYEIGWPLRHTLDIRWNNNPFLDLCDFIPDFLEKTNHIINKYISSNSKEFYDLVKDYKGDLYETEVEEAFVQGIDKFENKFDLKIFSNGDVLNYLENENVCYDCAMNYINEYKKYIGKMMKDNDVRNNYLSTIQENPDNPLHKARKIYKALDNCNAKNVHVFINKDGVDLDFKFNREELMEGCSSSYIYLFYMPAMERQKYIELFGKDNELTYKDIYKIEFRNKPLYIDNSFFNMQKSDEGYSL